MDIGNLDNIFPKKNSSSTGIGHSDPPKSRSAKVGNTKNSKEDHTLEEIISTVGDYDDKNATPADNNNQDDDDDESEEEKEEEKGQPVNPTTARAAATAAGSASNTDAKPTSTTSSAPTAK